MRKLLQHNHCFWSYCENDSFIDTQYRHFYLHYDKSKFKDAFGKEMQEEKLKTMMNEK